MSNVGYGAATPPPGERWSVNMPAVIGAVFVFLVGVIVWVVVSGGDDDGDGFVATATAPSTSAPDATDATTSTMPPTTPPPTAPITTPTVPGSTTPAPMPQTSALSDTLPPAPTVAPAPTTAAPATPPPTTRAPATTVATTAATTTTVGANGDLGITGTPISRPSCDGRYITVVASAIGDQATAASIGQVLDSYSGSSYLRTDLTCSSLNPSVNGQPIYVVYFGPFNLASEACAARDRGPDGAYARRLSDELQPDHVVDCSG